jgi:CelD/BcsL family acetyltransferase involved in cellulose biosynthesis
MCTSNSPPVHEALPSREAAQTAAGGAGAGSARLEKVTTPAALERLRVEWERLWQQAPHATPFQSPEWLLPWWKHIGRGTLATIAIRSAMAGELVALAPLYVFAGGATGKRHLFPIGIATTDYLDVLVKPGWEELALHCLASNLAHCVEDWDVLEFPQLRRGATLLGLAAPAGWRQEIASAEPHPVLMLREFRPGAGPALPPRMAQNVRYCRRRAARAGTLAYDTADARTLPAFLDALVRLHTRRWSERGLTGVLKDASVLAWHREATPLLQAAGLLRLHALRLDGEFIAVLYCLADVAPARDRRYYYYLGGFDPRFRSLSPGTLLVAHVVEQALAEGALAFDFLRGAESYKYRWGAEDQPMATLRLWHEHQEGRAAEGQVMLSAAARSPRAA